MRRRASIVVALGLLAAGREARALDAFEIQVYDGTANAPGVFGLELHSNVVASGATTAAPPELPPNHQAHFTLEPSYGLTRWWELGAYFQTALRADGAYDYAGVKLRSKVVTTPEWSARLRLGVNLEVGALPARYEADRLGLELRPIAALDVARLRLAANPIVDVPLTGGAATFEPAAFALYELPGAASFGLEYYASMGPVSDLGGGPGQEHYLYEVANLLAVRNLELNAGVGQGLTRASSALVVKVIVGYAFDRSGR
ncbi:MAG TPA: hypothetical protein VHL80_14060 [Polyangia bacterium]|nr:hypothetical protein [Polyangia bacterium]